MGIPPVAADAGDDPEARQALLPLLGVVGLET
jgi:hypothetical protein